MQDKIILGILQYRDMTSYEVKKAIENSTAFFYNASMGSIHPALKKLEKAGNVTTTDKVENGRAKKIYSITGQGRAVFIEWLGEGLPLEKFRDETLVRLFFFGHLQPPERNRYLAGHIATLEKQIAMLEVLSTQLRGVDVPEKMKSHAQFQIATLDFGLSYFRFSCNWYRDFLKENS